MKNAEEQWQYLAKQAARILDSIESLPVDDYGERVIPAGFLDEAREVIERINTI